MAKHIYLEQVPGGGKLKYRGVADKPGDDPVSFGKMMAARGLRMLALDEYKGNFVSPDGKALEG